MFRAEPVAVRESAPPQGLRRLACAAGIGDQRIDADRVLKIALRPSLSSRARSASTTSCPGSSCAGALRAQPIAGRQRGTPLAQSAGMSASNDDRLGRAARHFVRDAAERMRVDAEAALECMACSSTLGVRRHLQSLRSRAERCARIERHILHRSSRAARLRRAADDALRTLDGRSPARLARALAHVRRLAT